MRLHKTVNVLFIAVGYILVTGFELSAQTIVAGVFLYICFGILMYGGLYSFNSVADRVRDHKNGLPNPLYKLSLAEVLLHACVAFVFVVLGQTLISIYFRQIVYICFVLIGIKLVYSFVLKRYFMIGGVLLIATTGPLKVMSGVLLAGGNVYDYWWIFIVHYVGSVIFHGVKNYRRGLL